MHEKILVISENDEDLKLLEKSLKPDQFIITQSGLNKNMEEKILKDSFPVILADYDLIRDKADIFHELQKGPSKACLIFYGDRIEAEEANQILQNGVYTIIPRPLLSERVYDAIISGLENRRAFIEILAMMDELKGVNEKLEEEKDTLRKRNQELSFINHLSREISYDLDWDRILTRMIETGLEKTLDYSLFGVLYRIGSNWNLAIHLTEKGRSEDRDTLKSRILERLSSYDEEKITEEEVNLQLVFPEQNGNKPAPYQLEGMEVLPLILAGKRLGSVFTVLREAGGNGNNKEILMNTLANILSLSLKNAQEYHKVKEAAVTDSLTGVYNRKGLFDFLKKELSRARRYGKPLSFVLTDMDDFKNVNDSMGHQAGDYVLREIAGTLKTSIRQPDIVARYGGDEFAILLPETLTSEAQAIMGRISHKIEGHTFEWGSGKIKTSMSYGISCTDELSEGDTEEVLVRLADSRLYKAKNS